MVRGGCQVSRTVLLTSGHQRLLCAAAAGPRPVSIPALHGNRFPQMRHHQHLLVSLQGWWIMGRCLHGWAGGGAAAIRRCPFTNSTFCTPYTSVLQPPYPASASAVCQGQGAWGSLARAGSLRLQRNIQSQVPVATLTVSAQHVASLLALPPRHLAGVAPLDRQMPAATGRVSS